MGWKPIPNFEGRYEINENAEIRKIWGNKPTIVKQSVLHGRNRVMLTTEDGKQTAHWAASLMGRTFFKGFDGKSKALRHRNHDKQDNRLCNLVLCDRRELISEKLKRVNGKPVAKLSESGEVIRIYPSIEEAVKNNRLSRRTISQRCNGKRKELTAIDGYIYRFDDDLSVY